MPKLKPYPSWICVSCGLKGLREMNKTLPENSIATFHFGTCDVCGKEKPVTEPRDYLHPKFKGHKRG